MNKKKIYEFRIKSIGKIFFTDDLEVYGKVNINGDEFKFEYSEYGEEITIYYGNYFIGGKKFDFKVIIGNDSYDCSDSCENINWRVLRELLRNRELWMLDEFNYLELDAILKVNINNWEVIDGSSI